MHYTLRDLRNEADTGSIRLFLDHTTGIVAVSWTMKGTPVRAEYGPDTAGIYNVRLEHLADFMELLDKIEHEEV